MIKQLIENAETILLDIKDGIKLGICLEENLHHKINNSCLFCEEINPEFKIGNLCPCHLKNISKQEHIKRLTKFIKEQKAKDK